MSENSQLRDFGFITSQFQEDRPAMQNYKENYADPNEMLLYHFKKIQNKVIVFVKILLI